MCCRRRPTTTSSGPSRWASAPPPPPWRSCHKSGAAVTFDPMALVTTPAVVLQTYRYSETSKVVRLATRELGVQSAIAKGALRPKSRFGAGLELLSEGSAQLYFREARELHTLGAFDLANLRRDLAADVGRFAGGDGARRGHAQDGPPRAAPRCLRRLHRRARRAGRGIAGRDRCRRGAGDLAALGRAGVRAVARGLRPRRHGHRSRRYRPRVLQRGRGRGRLPHLRAGPAAHPAAAAGVPGPARPERRRSGPAPARRATRGRPPPSRRPLRPTPLRRGGLSLGPRLFGASRIVSPPYAPRASPVRRFVIGTAGHIDHGKTALVKALTGVDTDRWEEEKRRGITIDLGFAPLPLDDQVQASVVDVPGHEGFVRNMLAGATGIDVALLVVAADEGLMPQTEEHLAIIELLGVRRGIPVITKRDLVEPEWLDLVQSEVSERLQRSRVRWEPAIAVSALTGAGLDELRSALQRVADDLIERPAEDLFRLPIDRVFAVAGAGTVVTGTTWTGTVAVGDAVRLLPRAREARARWLEVHRQTAERAGPGRRTALALVGVDKSGLARGHVAVP